MVGNEKDIDALLERERRCLCARSGRDLLCEHACTVWAKIRHTCTCTIWQWLHAVVARTKSLLVPAKRK